jgi:hypothetical protein
MKNFVITCCLAVVGICLCFAFGLGIDAYRNECIYLIGLAELCLIAALFLAFVRGLK